MSTKYIDRSAKKPFICKDKKQIPSFVFMCIVALYVFITLILGYNFLAAVAVALSLITSVVIFISVVFKKQIHLYLWISYIILTGGSLFIFSVWGAEGFGKSLGYNLMLTVVPLATCILAYFLDPLCRKNKLAQRIVSIILALLMIGSSLFYFLAMSMRMRPTVKSLQAGHDEYLNSINPKNRNANSPNILMILMDDMAYSDISCYSYLNNTEGKDPTIKTPTLDALAEEGVSFDNFYACSPVCSPSRFGILTGRYASRGYLDNVIFPTTVSLSPFGSTRYLNPFQFYNNVDGILGDEITFAEVLQSAGYNTALIGKWNLGDYGEYTPTNQGFDYFYGSYYVNDMTPYNMVREIDGVAEEVHSHWDMLDQSETTKILSEELDNYISDSAKTYKESGQPFLAYYATPWPHYPIFSGTKGDKTDDSYIACIEEFDTYLGKTIEKLKEEGVYDDTLIIFTSDNGPGREGVTGALRGRKNTTFDGGHKVPLIMSYPNHNGDGKNYGGTTVATNTMNIDLFPTILEYVGITNMPTDRIIDGKSLCDLLEGRADGKVGSSYRLHPEGLYYIKKGKVQGMQLPINGVDKDGNPQGIQMSLDGNNTAYDFKYFERVLTENSAFIDQYYKNYLFNLTLDPAEGYNISMTYPQVAAQLDEDLKAFRKSLQKNRRGIL